MHIQHPIWSTPFGNCSAQDIFQTIMSEIFEDIEGVEIVIVDILVWGASEEEHDTRLEKVFQCAQSRNLKLNKDKSQIKWKEISYIGHTLSEQRTKKGSSHQRHEKPHKQGETPKIPRYGNLSLNPNYSEISAPLKVLLEKNIE